MITITSIVKASFKLFVLDPTPGRIQGSSQIFLVYNLRHSHRISVPENCAFAMCLFLVITYQAAIRLIVNCKP